MKVEYIATTEWEIDTEKLFATYEDEWLEFLEGDVPEAATDEDRNDFIKEVLWETVPYFQDIGGVQIYDDYQINLL